MHTLCWGVSGVSALAPVQHVVCAFASFLHHGSKGWLIGWLIGWLACGLVPLKHFYYLVSFFKTGFYTGLALIPLAFLSCRCLMELTGPAFGTHGFAKTKTLLVLWLRHGGLSAKVVQR